MSQNYVVRHWQGRDADERVVSETTLVAENVIEALLQCVPIEEVETWRLDYRIWDYASLTDPSATLDMANYWDAEPVTEAPWAEAQSVCYLPN